MRKITIAIDGHSACGKSTTAKVVANKLKYIYVDSGAMYRAVTYYFIENSVDLSDLSSVSDALHHINIEFRKNSSDHADTWLNGIDVEEEIRSMKVSGKVSKVAAIPEVRRAMVAQQQRMGEEKSIVMDGRDIGTVVFPSADLKIFMTADPVIRAQRRLKELEQKEGNSSLEDVMNNLIERDRLDSTRKDSPLRKAEDAVVIDNSNLSFDEQVEKIIELANDIILA